MANNIEFNIFLDIVPVINMISLSRLIDGGAAMLVIINKNHNIVKFGEIINKFLVRTILRV